MISTLIYQVDFTKSRFSDAAISVVLEFMFDMLQYIFINFPVGDK